MTVAPSVEAAILGAIDYKTPVTFAKTYDSEEA